MENKDIVRDYNHNDYPELLKWYLERNDAPPPRDMLPANGFIVPMVCAGFLYLTDTTLGIIDCYISNPKISREIRDKCLNAITEEIIKRAKNLNCRVLMATSQIEAVKKRSEFHGFIYKGDTSVYMREI